MTAAPPRGSIALQRDHKESAMRGICAMVAALALAGCAGGQKPAEPELPVHPGAAWISGGKKPVMDNVEVIHEGFVYEKMEPSAKLTPLPKPESEADRERIVQSLRSKRNNSMAQSKKTLRHLQEGMNDMLKEKPVPLEK